MIGKNSQSKNVYERIPKDVTMAELGVWKGESSALFAKKTSFLYLVDSWSIEPYTNSNEHGNYQDYLNRYSELVGSTNPDDFQKYYDDVYRSVVDKFKDRNDVEIYRASTLEFFDWFARTEQERLDVVYLDASHDYVTVLVDLIQCFETLLKRDTGILFGDDYGNKVGVKNAVDDFLMAHPGKYHFENFYGNQYQIKIKL